MTDGVRSPGPPQMDCLRFDLALTVYRAPVMPSARPTIHPAIRNAGAADFIPMCPTSRIAAHRCEAELAGRREGHSGVDRVNPKTPAEDLFAVDQEGIH